jgi:LPS sulfotransferase NodH
MNVRSMALHHIVLSRARLRGAPAHSGKSTTIARSLIWASPVATYIICTNPRSGSWLLSEGLTSTDLAGYPREWFNISEEQQHRAKWRMDHPTDLTFAAYFRLARAESRTSNGVSGIKLHYYQLAELQKKLAAVDGFRPLSDVQLMSKAFPDARWTTVLP